jgi:hypothetical protein
MKILTAYYDDLKIKIAIPEESDITMLFGAFESMALAMGYQYGSIQRYYDEKAESEKKIE